MEQGLTRQGLHEKMMRRRLAGQCLYCSPHRGENASRKPKWGVKKPKEKK